MKAWLKKHKKPLLITGSVLAVAAIGTIIYKKYQEGQAGSKVAVQTPRASLTVKPTSPLIKGGSKSVSIPTKIKLITSAQGSKPVKYAA